MSSLAQLCCGIAGEQDAHSRRLSAHENDRRHEHQFRAVPPAQHPPRQPALVYDQRYRQPNRASAQTALQLGKPSGSLVPSPTQCDATSRSCCHAKHWASTGDLTTATSTSCHLSTSSASLPWLTRRRLHTPRSLLSRSCCARVWSRQGYVRLHSPTSPPLFVALARLLPCCCLSTRLSTPSATARTISHSTSSKRLFVCSTRLLTVLRNNGSPESRLSSTTTNRQQTVIFFPITRLHHSRVLLLTLLGKSFTFLPCQSLTDYS